MTFPNVLITGHQAFFTREALEQIARTTLQNLEEFEKNPVVQDFGNMLTVADMCRFLETKVEVTD